VTGSRVPLIIAVVLNVFLLGCLVGGAIWIYTSTPLPGGSLQVAIEQLPPTERDAFREALRVIRQDNRLIILDGQQARRDAAELLKQPTVDAAALSAALERARTSDVTMRTKVEQRIAEFAAASSPGVRLLLAETLVRHLPAPPAPPKKSP
jgi:uncharacterized membrane protein